MTYEEALAYIHGIYWRSRKAGLQRITELLERMGNPQDTLKVIHVAGTNGKGSVCEMTASVLEAAGYKTGLYISPFISRFNERMQINGVPIPDERLCEVTEYVQGFAEQMENLPTEFELVCAIGFQYFAWEKCDYVVVEVGVGGRLDATNVLKSPVLSVVTPIGLDHTAYLGDTVEKIAAEKCGIVKDHRPVVFAGEPLSTVPVVQEACRSHGSVLAMPDYDSLRPTDVSLLGQSFCYRDQEYRIALLGAHQIRNAALVLEAVEALRREGVDIPDDAVQSGLAAARWPGRFELVNTEPPVLVDGAHNPHGAQAAVEAAKTLLPGRHRTLVVGCLGDKDVSGMLSLFADIADEFIATQPDSYRAMPCDVLAGQLSRFGKPVRMVAKPSEAVKRAVDTLPQGGAVIALGSLYMVGELRAAFGL